MHITATRKSETHRANLQRFSFTDIIIALYGTKLRATA
jgi:hypothetical protein